MVWLLGESCRAVLVRVQSTISCSAPGIGIFTWGITIMCSRYWDLYLRYSNYVLLFAWGTIKISQNRNILEPIILDYETPRDTLTSQLSSEENEVEWGPLVELVREWRDPSLLDPLRDLLSSSSNWVSSFNSPISVYKLSSSSSSGIDSDDNITWRYCFYGMTVMQCMQREVNEQIMCKYVVYILGIKIDQQGELLIPK